MPRDRTLEPVLDRIRISAGRVAGTTTVAPASASRLLQCQVLQLCRPAAQSQHARRPRPLAAHRRRGRSGCGRQTRQAAWAGPSACFDPAAGTTAAIMFGSRPRHRHEGRPGSRSRKIVVRTGNQTLRAQVAPGDQLGHDADRDLGHRLRADLQTDRRGHASRSVSAMPASRRLSKMSRILRRLPIKPT